MRSACAAWWRRAGGAIAGEIGEVRVAAAGMAHPQPAHLLAHLHAVHQRGSATDGDRHVQRLGHLLEVGALLLAVPGVGVDAVRALHGMRDRERDQALLARGERTVD